MQQSAYQVNPEILSSIGWRAGSEESCWKQEDLAPGLP